MDNFELRTASRVVPTGLRAIYDRMAARFGTNLRLLSVDERYVTFEVAGMTDRALFLTLQQEQQALFPGGSWRYQILCPWDPRENRGISIQELTGPAAREYACGFNYY